MLNLLYGFCITENFDFLFDRGICCDILLLCFSTTFDLGWRGTPEHSLWILSVSSDIGYIRCSTALIKTIYTSLKISWVLDIALW